MSAQERQPQIMTIEVFTASEARSDEMHWTIQKGSPVVERDGFH